MDELVPSASSPEFLALVADLGLIRVGSPFRYPDPRQFIVYTRHHRFCDIYRAYLAEKKKKSQILCRELARRNQKYSRHVFASYYDN